VGSNRRPPPCQISNPSEMARHPRRPSDKERQYLCGFNASFPASYLSLSEIKRTLPRGSGMAGLRRKARHKSRRDFPEFQAELVVGIKTGHSRLG